MSTLIGTAAIAAQFACALTAVQAPTVTNIEEPTVYHVRVTNEGSSRSLLVTTVDHLTTIAANEAAFEVVARPTTPIESLAGEIRQLNSLGPNWDGEGADKPKAQSIKEAVSFIGLLDDQVALPEPMLLGSGNAALYWNEDGVYADIEFLGDGRIAYFIKRNGDKHKGVLTFDSKKMPAVFPALLKV